MNDMFSTYEAPTVRVIKVVVEQGFAVTNGSAVQSTTFEDMSLENM